VLWENGEQEDDMAHGTDRWQRLMHNARERWDRLTEDDVQGVRGNAERMVSVLQARYGLARHEALKELTAWSRSLRPASHNV
jgi:uncharacterized protein YjbJ (UPF0337 family)